jgi:histidinol-phosphatase (PHP family)
MAEEELPAYLDLVAKLKDQMKDRIDVRLGLEADYLPGLETYLEKQLSSADFDYVLGSVHWHLPEWQDRFWAGDPQAFTESYFQQLAQAAETGLFDCLSHPDLIKNYSAETWDFEKVRPYVTAALDRIAETGVAMELNTSGRLKTFPEFNPGPQMLQLMHERDIPVVVGSDAHSPERVGESFGEALDCIEQAGYRNVRFYCKRQPEIMSLSAARARIACKK